MIKQIDEDKCDGCYVCVELCTKDVLRLDEKSKKAVIAYRDDCQTCYTCEMNCPTKAVFVDPMHRDKVRPW
jgi:NAD-dependent dihydropyrimidine dehydrogenase PreA subunit